MDVILNLVIKFLFGNPEMQINYAWMIPTAMIASSLIPTLLNKGGSKKLPATTVTQEPMMTKEQQDAMNMLLSYGKTGKWGGTDYTPGEQYTGKMGEYGMTGAETKGQELLSSLLGKGTEIGYDKLGLGQEELKKLYAGDVYDPYSETGLYKGFKRNVLKEASEAQDRLKRGAAYTGDLYSRDVVKRAGDIEEEAQASLQDKMAELYDVHAGRRFAGIPMALQADKQAFDIERGKAATEQGLGLQSIQASQQFGDLSRVLADIEAKEKYGEWIRGRKEVGDERTQQMGATKTVAGGTQWGAKNLTLPETYYNEPSPWSEVLNQLMKVGAEGLGKYGESAGWFKAKP